MGGLGSGIAGNRTVVTLAKANRRIELCSLRKRGMLRPGDHGSLSWNC